MRLNFEVGDSVWVSRGENKYYKHGWIRDIWGAAFQVEHSDGVTRWYDGERLERC